MSTSHPRPARLAGSRREAAPHGGLFVDYADVLAQAVANERHRILYSLRRQVLKLPVEDARLHSYGSEPRKADAFRKDVIDAINALDAEATP